MFTGAGQVTICVGFKDIDDLCSWMFPPDSYFHDLISHEQPEPARKTKPAEVVVVHVRAERDQ